MKTTMLLNEDNTNDISGTTHLMDTLHFCCTKGKYGTKQQLLNTAQSRHSNKTESSALNEIRRENRESQAIKHYLPPAVTHTDQIHLYFIHVLFTMRVDGYCLKNLIKSISLFIFYFCHLVRICLQDT